MLIDQSKSSCYQLKFSFLLIFALAKLEHRSLMSWSDEQQQPMTVVSEHNMYLFAPYRNLLLVRFDRNVPFFFFLVIFLSISLEQQQLYLSTAMQMPNSA